MLATVFRDLGPEPAGLRGPWLAILLEKQYDLLAREERAVTASVAGAVRAVIAAAPAGTFIRNADVPGSRAGVNTALSRLAADGEVVRVRNGLYWKGVKSRFGSGIPGLLDAAIAAAGGDGAGPSGWSAAQALGLSTQVPAIPEVAVAGPVPSLRGVRFHKRNNLARRDLSVCEIALLEALRSYPAFAEVSVDEFKIRVQSLAEEGKVRLGYVEKVARKEHSSALRRNMTVVCGKLPRELFA
jgi:Family of unknown function (DUF6088)